MGAGEDGRRRKMAKKIKTTDVNRSEKYRASFSTCKCLPVLNEELWGGGGVLQRGSTMLR